ncbi:hypothetical protein B0H63DRAFT_480706 [Podospora didyma]|uniref:Uncharacterized protein n=1 Tax=Podospora didyma TaxID=330526 RepID=A0AAE0KDQ1_9PEZI|nr:hypothetical protein B0H63DRAFT_480706 [Podospora didyma]
MPFLLAVLAAGRRKVHCFVVFPKKKTRQGSGRIVIESVMWMSGGRCINYHHELALWHGERKKGDGGDANEKGAKTAAGFAAIRELSKDRDARRTRRVCGFAHRQPKRKKPQPTKLGGSFRLQRKRSLLLRAASQSFWIGGSTVADLADC